eukprot:Gb_31427 [translate_table: standard]
MFLFLMFIEIKLDIEITVFRVYKQCLEIWVQIHPHILGVQQARMPLPSDVIEDEPVYVNAKQYRGILRRRQSRAKAELENKLIKVRKPYLHESRHRHAMRRARGCGGRFLNTKKSESKVNTGSGKASEGQHGQAVSSSGSEALQSENGNVNSLQEVQGNSGLSGSEVTSMSQSCPDGTSYNYSHSNGTYLNNHHSPHMHLSAFHPLSNGSDEIGSGQGFGEEIGLFHLVFPAANHSWLVRVPMGQFHHVMCAEFPM